MFFKQTKKMQHLLQTFKDRSNRNEKQLVSLTYPISNIEPLQLYSQLYTKYDYSMFWQNTHRTEVLIGLGCVKEFINKQNDLQQIYNSFVKIKNNCLFLDEVDMLGTSLILMGGMPFDPLEKKTSLWKDFPYASFVIPEKSFTFINGEAFFTHNRWIKTEAELLQMEKDTHSFIYSFVKRLHIEEKKYTFPHKKIIYELSFPIWKELIENAKKTICSNSLEKIVLARLRKMQFTKNISIMNMLNHLNQVQEKSYLFHIKRNDSSFIGATPERLIKVDDEKVLSTCLAGTAARGKTLKEDKQIKHELLNDDKNLKEHEYVVQMIKKVLTKHCHSIRMLDKPEVLTLSQLQHLFTPVTAKLCEAKNIFHLVEDLHPTPALGGTPTKAALAYIRENEMFDRGWYGAPIGWVDKNMNGEFAVAIRSALVKNDIVSLFAGCGIVADSSPELEYEETDIKFQSMFKALGG